MEATTPDSLLPKILNPTSAVCSPTTNSPAAIALRRKFPAKGQFLTAYNPDNQRRFCADLCRAYTGAAPTLAIVADAYGDNVSRAWLQIQLRDLGEYSGAQTKLDISQYQQLSDIISARYGDLKLTELMHFFQLCKQGEYGKLFFGTVDPMAIMDALRQFYRAAIDRRAEFRRGEIIEASNRQWQEHRERRERWLDRIPAELHHSIPLSTYIRLGYDDISAAEVAARISSGRHLLDLQNLKPL